MVRIVGCIPLPKRDQKAKITEIERLITLSDADIIVLPEEYFGGLQPDGRIISYNVCQLADKLEEIARGYDCGIVVGVVESEKDKMYQALWFVDERGRFLGSERKYNLARYEIQYGLASNDNHELRKQTYEIKNLRITGVLCWEIHDLQIRAACDFAKPDLLVDAIKFPINFFTVYKKLDGRYQLASLHRSDTGYEEWVEKIEGFSADSLSVVVASCNADFALREMPSTAKPLACVAHPSNMIQTARFLFGPKNNETQRISKIKIRRSANGTIAFSNDPGTFVSFDIDTREIRLIREGKDSYEAAFGSGTYPENVAVSAKAWYVRHIREHFKDSIGRSVTIKRDPQN